jgi:chromosome segregation ATPase
MKEMKKLKGKFPVEDFTNMKNRLMEIENNLGKLGKLAAGLKPIELPDTKEEGKKMTQDLEMRIASVEKIVGGGVSKEGFKNLEERMNDLKSNLPDDINKNFEKRLAGIENNINSKFKELEDIKKDVVESAIDQLLAQPGAVSKFVDEELENRVKGMEEKIGKMDKSPRSADSTIVSMMKDNEDHDKEIDRIKDRLQEIEAKRKEDFDSLETDVRALNASIKSVTSTFKSLEGSGVSGILRDLEILKTKADWLESTIQKMDLQHINDKIEAIEDKIDSSQGTESPMILE